MTKVNTFAAKLAVAFVATAMLFTMFAPATQAQTVEELQAQIAALMAQINDLTDSDGSTSSSAVCPYTWTRTLNTGDTGADVKMLQTFLNSQDGIQVAVGDNAGAPGMETSYYGPATGAAVAQFQEQHRMDILSPLGLENATTFFGNSTMAKANALCATAPVDEDEDDDATEDDDTTAPVSLEGGEATLLVDELFAANEVIDLGDAESVIEVELEAEDGDLEVNRADFMFDSRPWLYFAEVNLMVDGVEVASLSGSGDFTELTSGDYRARFSGLDLVIREDETVEVALELVALDSMSGDRDEDTVEVWHPEDGIRYVDGAGLTEYAPDAMIPTEEVEVTFNDVYTDGTITTTIGDDSPEDATIVLDETSRTTDISVLSFDVEAEDDDMEVTDVTVEFGTAGGDVADTLYRARLYSGSTLLGSESVTSASTIFDDLEHMIDEDDIDNLRVEVDFNDGEDVDATELTVVEVTVDAENSNYVSDSDTLSVNETHTLVVEGMVADIVGTPEITLTNDDKNAKFTFTMDVTAYENTFYFHEDTAVSATTTGASATTSITGVITTVDGKSVNNDGAYRVSKGETVQVTVEVFVTADEDETIRAVLETLDYATGTDGTSGTTDTVDLGSPDFRSPGTSIVGSSA